MNPSLSPPVICDECGKEHYDFNFDNSPNLTEIYSDGELDYCIDCLPKNSNSDKFELLTVYKRIGEANLNSGFIEEILKNFNSLINSKNEVKNNYIPQELESDSKIYKYALRFYKDMYDLSNEEFDEFKQLLIDENLDCFEGNNINTFKIGADNILTKDIISLNILGAICISFGRIGESDFKVSISRNGTVGAWDTYGLEDEIIYPDKIIESLNPIDLSDFEPDDLLD